MDTVNNFFAGFEFHQGGSVVFAQLAQGRAHVPDYLGAEIVIIVIYTGRATAEQFFPGFQLLVHFQSRKKSDALIIFQGGFPERNVPDGFPGFFVLLYRAELFLHKQGLDGPQDSGVCPVNKYVFLYFSTCMRKNGRLTRLHGEAGVSVRFHSKRMARTGLMPEITREGTTSIRTVRSRVPIFRASRWNRLKWMGTLSR